MPELDSEGLWDDDPGKITTATGRRVNPLTITEADVSIVDIATALSRQCRYNGHVGGFLSVARHSLWVSMEVPLELALAGLLHDAAEAYLGDLIRPLKHGSEFGKAYLEAEEHVERVVFAAFGLPYPMPPEVAAADNKVLTERELPELGARWTYHGTPANDQHDFLSQFHALYKAPSREPAMVVGLSGRRRAGKSEAARVFTDMGFDEVHVGSEILAELIELNVEVMASGGVRMPILSWLEYHDYEWLKDNTDLRDLQIDHGMVRRIQDPDYWLKKTMGRVKPGGRYVFSSVRFPNEADALRELGGEVWRINRRGYNPADGADVTETAMDNYPHFTRKVHNTGSHVEDFRTLVNHLAGLSFPALRQVP